MQKTSPVQNNFIHHRRSKISESIREVVFGAEDGMVSTLGALTGIAIGTADPHTVILAGLVIVAVESTSMSVGSFLSSKSVREVDLRRLTEEQEEIRKYLPAEKKELAGFYQASGWPVELASQMAEAAGKNPTLMLQEMAYRELSITPHKQINPFTNALFMFISYIIGGIIPVLPYIFFPLPSALIFSLGITGVGLYSLGVFTTTFTKRNWLAAGGEMLLLAGVAAAIGYAIGYIAERI